MEQNHIESSISWKGKYALLLKEIQSVKQEKEILIKDYEEKILCYKNEIEIEKHRTKLKETEFDEKLQVYQASIALQYDDLQSTFQARLDIVNQQLKDSNATCYLLRNQLTDLKNRFSFKNIESERRIMELEQSVTTVEEKLRRAEQKLIANRQANIQTYTTGIKLNFHSTNKLYSSNVTKEYEPLKVKVAKELSNENILTETNSSPNRPKRRKLYNIDEFID